MALKEPLPAFRLPGDISPLHYDLNITTHLHPIFRFEGDVKIKVKCLKPTKFIKIHMRDLNISTETVSVKDQLLTVVETSMDTENEFYIINTAEFLKLNEEYSIQLWFKGKLKEDLVGYYCSNYMIRATDEYRYLAVTHFEPSDARKAFPCFDEPGFKATFSIRLCHEDKFKAVSNMPLQSRTPIDDQPGWVWSEFEKTIPMSTYLVAYVVSDFTYQEQKLVRGSLEADTVTFKIWTREEAIAQTEFAATYAPRFLSYYEEYFGIKYPLPKLDLLAIPDFKISAMENWGIITFREAALLVSDSVIPLPLKLYVAKTIAHEVAHMWFGNLVTMWWWTDLWLKEGFATYMAGLAVNNALSKWEILNAESLSNLLRVFNLDSLKSSHPVSVPVGHSKEISQIFGAISYDKGSFLLRMMNLFLGEEVFRSGVSAYLKKHQFGNAEQDDLWNSLTEEAHHQGALPKNLTVKEIMDTWTLQTGYPLVTVTREYKTNKVIVSQERYLASKTERNDTFDKVTWWVPLTFAIEQDPQFDNVQVQSWLPKDKGSVVLDIEAPDDKWILFNKGIAGLYRVNYDQRNWQLLINHLKSDSFEKINVLNRALLIIDVMDLANSELLDYELALSLVSYVKNENALVPWIAALSKLEPIKEKLSRTPNYGVFKNFLRTLLTIITQKVGMMRLEPVTFERGQLMSLILKWSLPLYLTDLHDQAVRLFSEWTKSNVLHDTENPVPKDCRPAVYAHAVEVGGVEAWDFLWQRYKNANLASEKNNILMALANTREVWLIERYLEWTLSEVSGVRKQDAFLIFKMIASKEVGFFVAKRFFFRNIQRISDYYGAKSNLIGYYFSAIADQLIHQDDYNELKAFSEKYKDLLAPASLTVKQALEKVELNIQWIEKHYQDITRTLVCLTD